MLFDIEKFESQGIDNQMDQYWMRVSDQIQLLNRFVYLEWTCARIVAGWVPAAAEFEWKSMLTQGMWQDMTIAERLLKRKEELSSSTKVTTPSDKLNSFIEDVATADGFFPFLAGWFLEVKKGILDAMERYLEALDPIFDAPTLYIFEEILPRKRKQLDWAKDMIHNAVNDPAILEAVTRWRAYVRSYLLYLGGVDERLDYPGSKKPVRPTVKAYGPLPAKYSIPDWAKPGDLNNPPEEFKDNLKIFMWHYATEISTQDPMCYLFYSVDDMPFEFYVDLSRHIWDESRHHKMGVRRLQQMGYAIKDIAFPYTVDPLKNFEQFYFDLTMIAESCSFTRKKKSMDSFYAKGDIISGMTAEIDVVDERSHVKFGKKWVPQLFQKRLGDDRSLVDIVRSKIENAIAKHSMGEPGMSHGAFCGKIELPHLNYDKL